ncbi:hypothetical protein MCEZEM1_01796 [Comamonadaceae bacterium]
MRKIQFYSISQSFGEGSKGRAQHRIVSSYGSSKTLGKSLWAAGDEAYSVLQKALLENGGASGNIDDDIDESMDDLIEQVNDFLCRDFFPSVLEMLDEGKIGLNGGDRTGFVKAWDEYDLADRFLVFAQFVDQNPLAFKESSDFVPFACRLAAVSVLSHIDNAVLCMISGDEEGLILCGMEIEKMKTHLSPPSKFFAAIDVAVKRAFSEKGNKAVSIKLTKDTNGKQKDKALVRECWDAWKSKPNSYKSKAAFARDMREKFTNLESQPVIERWCREWEASSVTQPEK